MVPSNNLYLSSVGVKRIQAIIGVLVYYARAIKNKLLVPLSYIGSQQVTDTEATADSIKQLLYYVNTYPNDGIACRESDMVLAAHSDDGFHNESKGHICAGEHTIYLIMTLNPY